VLEGVPLLNYYFARRRVFYQQLKTRPSPAEEIGAASIFLKKMYLEGRQQESECEGGGRRIPGSLFFSF
jgi:hypothetical protein